MAVARGSTCWLAMVSRRKPSAWRGSLHQQVPSPPEEEFSLRPSGCLFSGSRFKAVLTGVDLGARELQEKLAFCARSANVGSKLI